MVAAGLVLVPYCLAAVKAVVGEDDHPNHGVVEDMVYLHHNVGDPDAAADLDALADPVASMAAASPGVLVSAPAIIPTLTSEGTPAISMIPIVVRAPMMIMIAPSKM